MFVSMPPLPEDVLSAKLQYLLETEAEEPGRFRRRSGGEPGQRGGQGS